MLIMQGNDVLEMESLSIPDFYPLSITNTWTDVPNDNLVMAKGKSSVGFWLRIQNGVSVKLRVLASFEENGNFYSLPIHSTTSTAVGMNPHEYILTTNGTQNLLFSVPLAGVIRTLKLQIFGISGELLSAHVSAKDV